MPQGGLYIRILMPLRRNRRRAENGSSHVLYPFPASTSGCNLSLSVLRDRKSPDAYTTPLETFERVVGI